MQCIAPQTQNAFRMLGVSEDATYDEITESYEELCTKYKGETKRLIRLQAAKDIVLEDRLRQRMAGTFKSEISQFNMDIGDNRKVAKLSLQDRLPNWMTDYVELPTKKLTLRNIVLFGFFSMLGVLSTTWVKGSIGLGAFLQTPPPDATLPSAASRARCARRPLTPPPAACRRPQASPSASSCSTIAASRPTTRASTRCSSSAPTRRAPPAALPEGPAHGTSQPPQDLPNARRAASSQKGPVGKAILVNLILAAFGAILSQILPLAFLAEEAVVAVGLNLGFFTSATFFKVQDEDGAWY